ncbi:MAG: cephalosporin hydroxylase family protein [Patescibacteria group bacterium]|nr:cephalosporin hydroxylase family protein [Patescibacteria group bacterium]
MSDKIFDDRNKKNIARMSKDKSLLELSKKWYLSGYEYEYEYHFKWLGLPIIQYPQDIVAVQEIIWNVKPDIIIETGIARGGSLIFYACLLELIGRKGKVLGIDIDIRKHNRIEIENHPMYHRISMIEGSSTDPIVVKKVHEFARGKNKVLVSLDSNHTHSHVLQELELYSPLVKKDSYIIVYDTSIQHLPKDNNRPWGRRNNPMTAVKEFLKTNKRFLVDKTIDDKLLVTQCPSGYLKCIRG